MTKQTFEPIFAGKTLSAKDLTVDEKKNLFALIGKYGIPFSSAYYRFFKLGFREWEIIGVSKLEKEFLLTSVCDGEDGNKGYGYMLTLDPNYNDSKFYELVTSLKLGKMLCDMMAEKGMTSQKTVRTRFRENNWKRWEWIGLRTIIDKFIASSNNKEQH